MIKIKNYIVLVSYCFIIISITITFIIITFMNYLISLEKILKIVHPFTDPESVFYQKEDRIKELLRNVNIFPDTDDSLEDKQLKALAYAIANYDNKEIALYIPSTGEIESIEEFIPSGFTQLAAATYLKHDTIVATLAGDAKLITELLKVDITKPDNIETLKLENNKDSNISWEVTPDMLQDTWGDPQFVIDYLYPCPSDEFKTKIQEVFKLALPTLWDDPNFIKEIITIEPQFFYHLSHVNSPDTNNLKFKDSVYELVKENPQYFNLVWAAAYNSQDQLFYEIENLDTPLDTYSTNEDQQQQQQQRKKIAYQIKTQLYTNIDYVSDMLLNRKMWHDEVYKQLPEDVKFSPKLLDTIYLGDNSEIRICPHYRLTEKHLNDTEWLENFIVKYCDKLDTARLNNYKEKTFNKDYLKDLYSPWIGSKKKVLNMLSKVQGKQFYQFYKVLPAKLRVDDDIVKAFMDYSHNSFTLMEEETREPYIAQFINNVAEGILSSYALSNEEIFKIKDKNLLIKIIEKGHIDWLKNKDCPKEWKTDPELLEKVKTPGLLVSGFNPDMDILNALAKNKSAILNILGREKNIYYHLPESLKSDEEILLGMLKIKIAVPQNFYAKKEFCLKAAMVNSDSCKDIPKQFWQEEIFIKRFFSLIDDKKISKNAIQQLPAEINQVLSAFNIKKDYSKFMDNFILNQKLQNTTNNKSNAVKTKLKL